MLTSSVANAKSRKPHSRLLFSTAISTLPNIYSRNGADIGLASKRRTDCPTNCHETGNFGACAIFSGNWRRRYEHPCMWKVRTHSLFSGQLGLVTSKSRDIICRVELTSMRFGPPVVVKPPSRQLPSHAKQG
ncbi:ankyrin repeat protein [Histoplasma capsulatum var. duboisii H88]|uniref:Ankyrin repeat protein n=1 Tax=Ajellomyces capsulatus (strain H88) TaxID=544711 RepID=A0A8A1LQD3_AJEC8|nr:ankyrin repeat protein [Histoplasma capsulatum var. duboisii H88]